MYSMFVSFLSSSCSFSLLSFFYFCISGFCWYWITVYCSYWPQVDSGRKNKALLGIHCVEISCQIILPVHTHTHLIMHNLCNKASMHACVCVMNSVKQFMSLQRRTWWNWQCAYAASCRQAPHQRYWSAVCWRAYRLSLMGGGPNPLAAGPK